MTQALLDEHGLVQEAPGNVKRDKPVQHYASGDAKQLCSKCKQALAQISVASDRRCATCLTSGLHAKLVKACKLHRAIVDGDSVLVALSGGPCSLALLDLLSTLHTTDWSRPQQGKACLCC